jgi:hypothetical protein
MIIKICCNTDLNVSIIGLSVWRIGGPALAGNIPIEWNAVDDDDSTKALERAYERGIMLLRTAGFYGLGPSEFLMEQINGYSLQIAINVINQCEHFTCSSSRSKSIHLPNFSPFAGDTGGSYILVPRPPLYKTNTN